MTISQTSFWAKVAKTHDCWNWVGTLRPNGYGKFSPGHLHAHRVSWELHFGQIPPKLYVCHSCDNRRCVRPDHLFLGTQSDNMRDAVRKGRVYNARGADSPNAKLTKEQANAIRQLHAVGRYAESIAREYSVSGRTIRNIVKYGGYS